MVAVKRVSPVVLVVATVLGCGSSSDKADTPGPRGPVEVVFREVTGPRVPSIEQTKSLDPSDFFGPGVAVGDVDGDGRPDVVIAGSGVYLNHANTEGFQLDLAEGATPGLDIDVIGVSLADFDRDGDLDLALCGAGGVRLLRNDGKGAFVDVSATAGVAGKPGDISASVAWGDLDGDGFLDLAVGNYGVGPGYDPATGNPVFKDNDTQPSHLYLNQRDGSFVEVLAPLSDPALTVRGIVTAFADFDADGLLDVYYADDAEVAIKGKAERHDLVLLNRGFDADGNLVLVESSAEIGLNVARSTMGCAIGNPDRGPGWDFFFTDIEAGWLFRSSSAGERYREAGRDAGILLHSDPGGARWVMWGSVFSDFDGDGFEDLLVSQAPIHDSEGREGIGPLLLKNKGGTQFELERLALGGEMRARANILVDLDLDGDNDVIVAPFYDRFRFIENRSAPRNYVRVTLRPTVSAPGAPGAIVEARSGDVLQKRMRMNGGQPHSDGEATLDFGLGLASSAEITVRWPSGAVQSVSGVSSGSVIDVAEPNWLQISDTRPVADGSTSVTITLDVVAAGLGTTSSEVAWESQGTVTVASAQPDGRFLVALPPRSEPGPVRGTVRVDQRELPLHPVVDYR